MIHLKGIKPAVQLPDFCGSTKALEFEITFTDGMVYSEPGNEGADWRKLTGISLDRFGYHNDACLIGWRYYGGEFQLVPYFHFSVPVEEFDHKVGSFDGYFNDNEIQSFNLGDIVSGAIHFDNGQWTVKIGRRVSLHPHQSVAKRGYRVLTWFGGTLPPAKTFKMLLKLWRKQ